ncbi:MAG: DUF6152 family protein [Gammaproteobacteria bacterium]|jgi:hypothetical protein|nr:DUF6152 family protein [Gammaproteobacteria bacterium]
MKYTNRATPFFLLLAGLFVYSLPVSGHHSFPAQYDASKTVTLNGKVTRVEWTNPHIFIYIDVADDASGRTENWALELGGPNALLRAGWKRNSLKTDDVITVDGALARDGSNLVNATSIVLDASGKRMLTASSRDNQNE